MKSKSGKVKNTRKRREKFSHFLSLLQDMSPEKFETFCCYLSDDGCEMFFECIHNVIYNDKISNEVRMQLKEMLLPVKNEVKYMAKISNSFKKKRRLMCRLGTNLPFIVEALKPLLQHYIEKKSKK